MDWVFIIRDEQAYELWLKKRIKNGSVNNF